MQICFGRWGGRNHNLIQRSKQRYSNMLWNMWSITRHKRSYGQPLHPDLTPDVLTCVLPLATVSSGRESEVESAHLFLTLIQFFSACHLTTQHTSTCIHNSIIYSPTHYKSPGRWASGEAVGVGYTGSCSCRPAHRRLSSIWSLSVRRSSQRNSAVD